jgi:acyl carrier protein
MNQPSPLQPIREWLLSRKPGLTEIPDALDLIEQRVVDSISFVEYVLLIEELSGQEIAVDDTTLDKVRTLERVALHYFSSVPVA